MGILDAIRTQFIEVIEWLDSSGNTMLFRFPVHDQEIKNGARLTVRESQAAIFVFQGQVADVFPPGLYTIDGGNTPILTKLGAWKYGFTSPFKAEVYFVNTKQFTDLQVGHAESRHDARLGFWHGRLRAFIYSMRSAITRLPERDCRNKRASKRKISRASCDAGGERFAATPWPSQDRRP
jgi:membrane protease subunit (stomatin/prohibitin family)